MREHNIIPAYTAEQLSAVPEIWQADQIFLVSSHQKVFDAHQTIDSSIISHGYRLCSDIGDDASARILRFIKENIPCHDLKLVNTKEVENNCFRWYKSKFKDVMFDNKQVVKYNLVMHQYSECQKYGSTLFGEDSERHVFTIVGADPYSPTTVWKLSELVKENGFETISCRASFIINEPTEAMFIFSVGLGDQTLIYEQFSLRKYSPDTDCQDFNFSTFIPSYLPAAAEVKLYLWNAGDNPVHLCQLQVGLWEGLQ
jgi:hypothetical protein